MKISLILLSALTALALSGCASGTSADHHDHAEETHNHEAEGHEGHDHEAEGHDHEAEMAAGHDHEAEAAAEADHDEHAPGVILLDQHQAESLGLTYDTVTPAPFASVIRTGGSIEAAPGDRSTVTATTSGIVSFGGRQLTEGSKVAKGSAFLILGSAGMAEGNYPQQLADARATLAKAEADYARAESLSGNQVVSGADLEAARLAVDIARRQVAVLSENATQGGKSIVAPLGGYVTSLAVSEGDYVTAGQPLATISANRNLVLRADLPQRHLAEAAQIRTANFTTPYDGQSYDLAQLGGRMIGSARSVGDGSPTLPIRFEFENRGNLTAGSVVEVFLKGATRNNILTVPLSALTEEQGAHYLYVRTSPGHYLKKAVRVGATDGARIEIVSGIAPGDEVVATGAYYVRLASMSNAIPHGHSHSH